MAEAWTSGAQWEFPSDLPGSFSTADVDEAGEQIKREAAAAEKEKESGPQPPHAEQYATDGKHSDPPPTASAKPFRPRAYPPRTCRICLEVVLPTFHPTESATAAPDVTYESEEGGRLIRPCKCKGSQKYVHADCLRAWRTADPLQKRNYWQCPTCRYSYKLARLTWANRLSSTATQVALTVVIFVASMFLLGFVADPIINLYLDPVTTIATAGGPTGSLVFEDEDAGWGEHFVKGLASLGLLGFAKVLMGLSPWHWFNMRGGGGFGGLGRSAVAGTGRGRVRELSWITIVVGVGVFLWGVWKGVRAWARRTLEKAGDRVMDVQGEDENEEDD